MVRAAAGRSDPEVGWPLASDLRIEPVRTARQRDAFIELQLELYRGDPHYVPPIVAERRDFLDRGKNPFLGHAELELFLAYRGGRAVGRIAAVNDRNYNQFHDSEVGFFGMFECVEDPEVAAALVDAAASWVRGQGMKKLLGPVNLSTNHDCGLLVDGFDYPPAMMMPYNFRYYARLLEAQGLRKAKDLWAWELSTSVAPPEKVVRVAQKVRQQSGARVRPLNVRDLDGEKRRIKRIYDAMLERNWGFVPMSEEEFDFIAFRLRPLVLIRPELCLIAEVGDEPVAFSITLPDSNVGLKAANGHLTTFGLPLGLAKMAWAVRNSDRLRVVMLGITPGYRRRGVDALLSLETVRLAREFGYSGGEVGWTTEDNTLINRAIEAFGARRYKTYRIYERAV
jgi:GNAT superfamily N-acetyltransferase